MRNTRTAWKCVNLSRTSSALCGPGEPGAKLHNVITDTGHWALTTGHRASHRRRRPLLIMLTFRKLHHTRHIRRGLGGHNSGPINIWPSHNASRDHNFIKKIDLHFVLITKREQDKRTLNELYS